MFLTFPSAISKLPIGSALQTASTSPLSIARPNSPAGKLFRENLFPHQFRGFRRHGSRRRTVAYPFLAHQSACLSDPESCEYLFSRPLGHADIRGECRRGTLHPSLVRSV